MHLMDAINIAKECGLNTIFEAICNADLYATNIFSYKDVDRELLQLHSEWNTAKKNSEFTDESSISDVLRWMTTSNEPLVDELGGIHDECLGWSPSGTFCGECNNITCVGCYAVQLDESKSEE